jgi:4-hydroxy-3-polyprenylbenzoate decarboxylase
MRIIVGVTGATGAIYAARTLRALLIHGHRVELVVSKYGTVTLKDETSFGGFAGSLDHWLLAEYGADIQRGALSMHNYLDQTAPIASGSGGVDGMVVVPCTMKTLAGIAHGYSNNLIERSADVVLKEKKPLVLVPREAPYNLIHLRNMVAVAEAGAAIVPASPAFYQHPRTFDDLGDFIAARALNLLGIRLELFPAWQGLDREE